MWFYVFVRPTVESVLGLGATATLAARTAQVAAKSLWHVIFQRRLKTLKPSTLNPQPSTLNLFYVVSSHRAEGSHFTSHSPATATGRERSGILTVCSPPTWTWRRCRRRRRQTRERQGACRSSWAEDVVGAGTCGGKKCHLL